MTLTRPWRSAFVAVAAIAVTASAIIALTRNGSEKATSHDDVARQVVTEFIADSRIRDYAAACNLLDSTSGPLAVGAGRCSGRLARVTSSDQWPDPGRLAVSLRDRNKTGLVLDVWERSDGMLDDVPTFTFWVKPGARPRITRLVGDF
jgi:hypothetical protein